jgi:D-alanyl-D-alanine carboxypeptidase
MKSTPERPPRRPLLAALTLSALLTTLVPATARGAAARPLDLARLEARIAAAIGAPVAAGDVPGVSAAVITRDGAVHAVTAGVARRAPHEKPLTINGKMLSGSIGKTYCAVVVLQLVAEGTIDLDAKVAKYLGKKDWFGRLPNASSLSVRSLMNHTSGIPEHVWSDEFRQALADDPWRSWELDELLRFVLDAPPLFGIGEQWSYADTNYLVLGSIIEEVTGRAYEDELRDRVLAPLGLDDTLPTTRAKLDGLVSGYTRLTGMFPVPAEVAANGRYAMNPQFERTGGGLCSTAADLARFGHALFTTDLVRDDLRRAMVSGAIDAGERLGPGGSYGLGVIVQESEAGTWWGHMGIMPGYLSGVAHYADRGITVAVQMNSDEERANERMKGLLVELARVTAPAGDTIRSVTPRRDDADAGWPQFRGPRRDGISTARGLPSIWPEGGPRVRWRQPVGEGFAEVTVAGGRLFVLQAQGDAEFAVALDDPSGRELWRTRLGPRFSSHFGNGPRATPVLSDGVLYILTAGGTLHALNMRSGAPRWRVDLVADHGGRVPDHGYAASPLVIGDLLLVEAGGSDGRAFVALDRKSGKVRWTAEDGHAGYASGIEATIDGVRQAVFVRTMANEVISLLPNGEVLWRYAWPAGPIGMPLFVPPDRIFVSASEDPGDLRLATRCIEENGHTMMRKLSPDDVSGALMLEVRTVDGTTNSYPIWTSRFIKNHFSSSILLGDHIYGFDRATLQCVSAATGELLWAQRGFGRGSLIAADGMLYVLGENGTLALVEATPAGYREMGRFAALSGQSWTAPALAGGRLYLRNLEEMACIDLPTSAEPSPAEEKPGRRRR